MRLIKPGLLTTVQDTGRKGYQQYGVIESGAMDPFALRCANLLVGNPEGEAALEFSVTGPDIYFADHALIAITGGDFPVSIDGRPVPHGWRPLLIRRGSILRIGAARSGVRGYLAVSGGLDVPTFMNSRSTDLRAGLGGLGGRALQAGDILRLRRETDISREIMDMAEGTTALLCPKAVSGYILPLYGAHSIIRVLRGPHFERFDEASREMFFARPYKVLPQSDRMGYRLEGSRLSLAAEGEIVSEGVTFGTVQVPADGQPIVLLADHATTGGYPNIAQVISVDWPLLAQSAPGAEFRFREVTLKEAQELLMDRESDLRLLKAGMALELPTWRQWRELP